MTECTLWTVAAIFGKRMPEVGKRGYCVFREHKRKDRSLAVFTSRTGDVLYKCFSCDPPYNVGDAITLYQGMFDLDRRTAWSELRDRGYRVPGLDADYKPRPDRVPRRKRAVPRYPVQGDTPVKVLALDQDKFAHWQAKNTGALERFAEMRGLDPETLRDNDVVDITDNIIGFGYRNWLTGVVTRVKMRPLDRKLFWIEPKPTKENPGKADGPLYLAHDLNRLRGLKTHVIITEGEVDALTLRDQGFRNVVSLPDGSASAKKVDIRPISTAFCLWLVATDADEEGMLASTVLKRRAAPLGIRVGPVVWRKDGQVHKDANDALRAGFKTEDFARCLDRMAEDVLGYPVRTVGT